MDRRDFILNSGKSLVALTLLGSGAYSFAASAEASVNCLPTTADILGPFYRANAPIRSDLTVAGQSGSPLLFKGRVFDHLCNPIEGATVDVWHADDAGGYDNSTPAFNYRGKNITPADGSYSFNSVEPGWYLNGAQYRPRHIHFRVTAPGHTELITQLYFQNDPYISNDPWASQPNAQLRIVPIDTQPLIPTATFDIYLQGTATGIQNNNSGRSLKIGQNPFYTDLVLYAESDLLALEVFNTQGELVARQYDIRRTEVKLHLPYLPAGIYYARVQTESAIEVLKVVKQ